jgi:lipoate-protein ligase A
MWELILDGALQGLTNMVIDATLLDEVAGTEAARTIVRFYSWNTPTVSLGRNQKIESSVDLEFCRSNGIDVVHRPTGGRAVLHDDELTYAVISNDTMYFGDTIYGNYRRVSEALCLGYIRLGVPAVLAPDTRKVSITGNGLDPPCFLSPSRYELMAAGRKIVGSAQRRVRRSFLQHGSMPLTVNRAALARATRMSDSGILDREMAGIAEFLPVRPRLRELTENFVRAFQDYFNITFEFAHACKLQEGTTHRSY